MTTQDGEAQVRVADHYRSLLGTHYTSGNS